jgi:hypothetical protein
MAFAFLASVGGSSKTAGTSVGSSGPGSNKTGTLLLVVSVAVDNTSTGSDGDNSEITSVTDTLGNVYTKVKEFTNTQGAAAGGATVSVWTAVMTGTFSTADSATANYSSRTAQNAGLHIFSIGSGKTVSVAGTPQTLANDGVDPGSMTIGSLASQEYLFFRATAYEAAGLSGTPTTNYTQGTNPLGTSGGGAASNMGLYTEHRILTGTGDTSDPTVTAADCASVYVAFQEVTPATSFIFNPTRDVLAPHLAR